MLTTPPPPHARAPGSSEAPRGAAPAENQRLSAPPVQTSKAHQAHQAHRANSSKTAHSAPTSPRDSGGSPVVCPTPQPNLTDTTADGESGVHRCPHDVSANANTRRTRDEHETKHETNTGRTQDEALGARDEARGRSAQKPVQTALPPLAHYPWTEAPRTKKHPTRRASNHRNTEAGDQRRRGAKAMAPLCEDPPSAMVQRAMSALDGGGCGFLALDMETTEMSETSEMSQATETIDEMSKAIDERTRATEKTDDTTQFSCSPQHVAAFVRCRVQCLLGVPHQTPHMHQDPSLSTSLTVFDPGRVAKVSREKSSTALVSDEGGTHHFCVK